MLDIPRDQIFMFKLEAGQWKGVLAGFRFNQESFVFFQPTLLYTAFPGQNVVYNKMCWKRTNSLFEVKLALCFIWARETFSCNLTVVPTY